MGKLFAGIAIFFLGASPLWANPVGVPQTSDYFLTLEKNLTYYEDTTRSFDPLKISQYHFSPGKGSYGVVGHPIWLKMELENLGSVETETRVWLKDSFFYDLIEIYIAPDGKPFTLLGRLGASEPFTSRLHLSKDIVVPLKFSPMEKMNVLMKIDNRASIYANPVLVSPNTYEYKSRNEYVLYGLFFGAIMISLLYHLLLYYRLREISLFYYSAYLTGLIILFLALSGVGPEFVWSHNFQAIAGDFASALVGLTLLQFTRSFLRLPILGPRIDRVMSFLVRIMGILIVVSFFRIRSTALSQSIFAIDMAVIIASISGIIVALKERYHPSKPFALAWAFFFLGAIMILLAAMGVTQRSFLSQYGMQIGALIQIVFLSLASADRIADAQQTITSLTKQRNAELEYEVTKRTKDLREILDNVRSGFFLIDRNHIVQSGFTASCSAIVGHELAEGMHLRDVLRVDENSYGVFRLTIDQVFDDLLPSRVTLSLVPNRVRMNDRSISIDGSAIQNNQQRTEKILFTISDVTKLVEAERQKKIDNALIGIFRQKSHFLRFLSDFRMSIRRARKMVKETDQMQLRHLLHTIKGNASVFSLDSIVQTIHEIEDHETLVIEDVALVERNMRIFFDEFVENLGISYDSNTDEICQIEKSRVREFRMRLGTISEIKALKELSLEFSEEICRKLAKEFLLPLETMARTLAGKLEKDINVVIRGKEIGFDPSLVEPILQNLPHLVRNSVSHGIEFSSERLSHKKSLPGVIKIMVEESPDHFVFKISDDGRGIDPEKIANVAVAKGIITKEKAAQLSDSEKQWLIFAPTLSTAEEITDVSGRGIGMDSVLASVQKVGAKLTLESVPGHGTAFTITVNKPKIKVLS